MASAGDLIFEDCTVDPGTYALVGGVGPYPHLTSAGGRLAGHADGLGQLSSRPISARAFAQSLPYVYRFPEKPC